MSMYFTYPCPDFSAGLAYLCREKRLLQYSDAIVSE